MNVAVVLGASSGIGRAVAQELCKNRSKSFDEIILVARRIQKLQETAESLEFTRVKTVECDLRDTGAAERIRQEIGKENKVKWLVLSAGTGYYEYFSGSPHEHYEEMIDLNCRVNAAMIHAILPFCGEGTKIVNIASASAFSPQPGFAVYAATKSFTLSFSEAIGRELKKTGITVTAVCPGPCDTEFLERAGRGRGIPEFKKKFMISPDCVAKKAVTAAVKGRAVCIPTFKMKMAYAASKILPSSVVMTFLERGNRHR